MKYTIQSTIVALVVSGLCSCKQEPMPKNLIVPVDFTNSRDGEAISWYKETIKASILSKVGRKDIVTVIPVDRNSELWSEEIFRYNFGGNQYGNEYAGLQSKEVEKKNLQDTVAAAITRFDKSFDTARTKRIGFAEDTDVFGALRLCRKYFLQAYQNNIVLFSDMQQVTDKKDMNFEKHLNTEKEIEPYLKKVDKLDLQQSRVLVLTGPQTTISAKKFTVIKKFWEEYFRQNNAQLIDYSSGTVTTLEQLMSGK